MCWGLRDGRRLLSEVSRGLCWEFFMASERAVRIGSDESWNSGWWRNFGGVYQAAAAVVERWRSRRGGIKRRSRVLLHICGNQKFRGRGEPGRKRIIQMSIRRQ